MNFKEGQSKIGTGLKTQRVSVGLKTPLTSMFISHWFEFSGIDQVMAPIDPENADELVDGNDDTKHNLLARIGEIVAPRSQPSSITSDKIMGASATNSVRISESRHDNDSHMANEERQQQQQSKKVASVQSQQNQCIECQHCHQMTPIIDGSIATAIKNHPTTPAAATSKNEDAINNSRQLLLIKQLKAENIQLKQQLQTRDETNPTLINKIFQAAQETAHTASSPTFEWESIHNLFFVVTAQPKKVKLDENGKPIPSKNVKKLTKILTNQPKMVCARSYNIAGLPDGYTILHAACVTGNIEVVEYILNNHLRYIAKEEKDIMLDLNKVDLQGRTALHIIANSGHKELTNIMKEAYDRLKEVEDKLEEERRIYFDYDGSESCEDNDKDDDPGESKEEVNDDMADGELTEEMAKLTTADEPPPTDNDNTSATPSVTPRTMKSPKKASRSPKRRTTRTPKTPMSSRRSPKPSSRSPMRSPAFKGANAPLDLSGRSPLGMVATSSAVKTKKNRAELDKALYSPGDPSIVGQGGIGERTPPKFRCGPQQQFLSPSTQLGGGNAATPAGSSKGRPSTMIAGTNSYLSPTPRKNDGMFATPAGSLASSNINFATPFESPQTILEEEEDGTMECEEGLKATTIVRLREEDALQLKWGLSDMNGRRVTMEDAMLVKYPIYQDRDTVPTRPSLPLEDVRVSSCAAATGSIPTVGIFGLFDGHGDGGHASKFISTNFLPKLQSQPEWPLAYHSFNDLSSEPLLTSILTKTCFDLDEDLKQDSSKPNNGGSTAVMALVSDRVIVVSNVGDSRGILVRRKKEKNEQSCWEPSDLEVIAMSEDHKPNLPKELARIEAAGLSVKTDYVPPNDDNENGEVVAIHRVKKSDSELLGVSRAFGDNDYKSNKDLPPSDQAVTCTPDIVVRERSDDEDMYLILACDGVSILSVHNCCTALFPTLLTPTFSFLP